MTSPSSASPTWRAGRAPTPTRRETGHVSGATDLDDVDLSIHPLQTFSGAEPPEVFRSVGAAVDGRTDDDHDTAERLAGFLGMTLFGVRERAAFHAAASFASNFVLTVLEAAEQLARDAGIDSPRDLLAPLVRQSVDNWQRDGAAASLTDPIARGDEAAVARQRAAVVECQPLFDALSAATSPLAQRSRA